MKIRIKLLIWCRFVSQLSKQNSILSLTLDEFYCKNGKRLGSMNMDEFLSSIWNSDDNNQVNLPQPTLDEAVKGKSVVATPPTLPSQKKRDLITNHNILSRSCTRDFICPHSWSRRFRSSERIQDNNQFNLTKISYAKEAKD